MIVLWVLYASACCAVIGYRWARWLGAFYGAVFGPLGALMAWCHHALEAEPEAEAGGGGGVSRDQVVRGNAPRRH